MPRHQYRCGFKIYGLLILSIALCFIYGTGTAIVYGAEVKLAWDPNSESNLSGYYLYYKSGQSGPLYDGTGVDQGPSPIRISLTDLSDKSQPQFTLTGLSEATGYYFTIAAYSDQGEESGFSNEVYYETDGTPPNTAGYTITASAGTNGTIYPNGNIAVNEGDNQVFTISPLAGYHITNVTVDGNSVGPVETYSFTGIQSNHSIHAGFAINTYTVSVSAGNFGSITPHGNQTVTHGDSLTFTIIPDSNYQITDVIVDGESVGVVNTHSFNAIQSDHSINAIFSPISEDSIEKIWFEAEEMDLVHPMQIGFDENALSNSYISVPPFNGNVWNPEAQGGYAEYRFNVRKAGNFIVWGRVKAENSVDDSFYVSIDNGEYMTWDTQRSREWIWDMVNSRNVADPMVIYLESGYHYLKIKQREDNTKLDKILITNDMNHIPMDTDNEIKIDTDNDGIVDEDEITIYNTDPHNPDSDGDGINDNDELNYWKEKWNLDFDNDGLVNLLDPDSDNDGTLDGLEIETNLDPAVPDTGGQSEMIWIEAEEMDLVQPMEPGVDKNASLSGFISCPPKTGNVWNPEDEGGYAEYCFEVKTPGEFIIWGRVLAQRSSDNSFYVSLDDGEFMLWDTKRSAQWSWDMVGNRNVADPVVIYLDKGSHYLKIKQREDNTKLDQLLITNDINYDPTN